MCMRPGVQTMVRTVRTCLLLFVFMFCAAMNAGAYTNGIPDVRAFQQAVTSFVQSDLAQETAAVSRQYNLVAPAYIAAHVFEYDRRQCTVTVEFGGPVHQEAARQAANSLCAKIAEILLDLGMSKEQCRAEDYVITVVPYARLAGGNWIYGAASMKPGNDRSTPFWAEK